MRPVDIEADVKEMERRKRVEAIMNSQVIFLMVLVVVVMVLVVVVMVVVIKMMVVVCIPIFPTKLRKNLFNLHTDSAHKLHIAITVMMTSMMLAVKQ